VTEEEAKLCSFVDSIDDDIGLQRKTRFFENTYIDEYQGFLHKCNEKCLYIG
jgi:hypothetical protein